MSLNLNKYTPHISKKTFDLLTKFIEAYLLCMLAVLHFTDLYTSFCSSYIAMEVTLFQFIKKTLTAWSNLTQVVSISIDSSKSIKY